MNAFGQEMPAVKFNHLSFVLESDDLRAISESGFLSEKFIACQTRRTNEDGPSSRTTVYLYGPSSYLELFEAAGDKESLGVSALAFSVDKMGELDALKSILEKTRKTLSVSRERDLDGAKVPWFDVLFSIDPAFAAQSRSHYWIMEYRTEYFKHNNFPITNNELTRENYLQRFAPQRENKIIRRISGVTMKLSSSEKQHLEDFFMALGFQKTKEGQFILPDNFRFFLQDRISGDPNTIASIEFETSSDMAEKETIRITDHVFVTMEGHHAQLIFK